MNTELTSYTIITKANLTNIIHNAKLFVYFEINATINVTMTSGASDKFKFYISTPDSTTNLSVGEYMNMSEFSGGGACYITKNDINTSSNNVVSLPYCVAFNKFTYNSLVNSTHTGNSRDPDWKIDTNDSLAIRIIATVNSSSSDSYSISGDITAYYI